MDSFFFFLSEIDHSIERDLILYRLFSCHIFQTSIIFFTTSWSTSSKKTSFDLLYCALPSNSCQFDLTFFISGTAQMCLCGLLWRPNFVTANPSFFSYFLDLDIFVQFLQFISNRDNGSNFGEARWKWHRQRSWW